MNAPSFTRPVPIGLRVMLSLGFLLAAITKFVPGSSWYERFAAWGYPLWFVPLVGALEVLGGVGLWVPRASGYAMLLLAGVLLEATYANVSHPPIAAAIRPTLFLTLLALLFFTQRRLPRGLQRDGGAAT